VLLFGIGTRALVSGFFSQELRAAMSMARLWRDQGKRDGVNLNGAHFPCAREAGADTPSSVSRSTRAMRPAGAA